MQSATSDREMRFEDFGIPSRGIEEALRGWALRGSVLRPEDAAEVLGGTSFSAIEDWRASDLVARCQRVLWGIVEPGLREIDPHHLVSSLPAESVVAKAVTRVPQRPVDWRATVRANRGWPGPCGWESMVFYSRPRQRARETALLRVIRWLCRELGAARAAAQDEVGAINPAASSVVDALGSVDLMAHETSAVTADDLSSVSRLGGVWGQVASVGMDMLPLLDNPVYFARHLVLPQDDLRWRLFHLGVYGELLFALGTSGWSVRSQRPLRGRSNRPNHVASNGEWVCELWFEADGCWNWYGVGEHQAYQAATASSRSRSGELAPDCLAVVRDPNGVPNAVLALECKYSLDDHGYVVRQGYLQSTGYAIELSRVFDCEILVSTVGPGRLVDGHSISRIAKNPSVDVGLAEPDAVRDLVTLTTADSNAPGPSGTT